MAIFGPLIVVIAQVARRGIVGLLEAWPKSLRHAAAPSPPAVSATHAKEGA
jgi:hypothetical protein